MTSTMAATERIEVPTPRRAVVAQVWTRNLDGELMAGRLRVAQAIRAALSPSAELESLRLPSVVADRSAGRLAGVAGAFAVSLLRGQPLPIQCAIFAAGRDLRGVARAIPDDVDAVYLDGIRCYSLLRLLRTTRPDLKIVVDFDDLMSRRMDLLLAAGQPLSPGYLTARLPRVLRRLANGAVIGRAIVLYERATLRALERRALTLADTIVLLSSADAAALEGVRSAEPRARARIAAVPPAAEVGEARPLTSPLRFVFVGTDALTQNRLTIDYLLRLWRTHDIASPLVIFGRQTRGVTLPPAVIMAGYVESLDEIFDGRSVLLTPSFLRGGIKTKVLEAFGRGAPVIGNDQTFEGLPVDDYPLRINDEVALLALLRDPEGQRSSLQAAAEQGHAYVSRQHSPSAFSERWRELMGVQAVPTGSAACNETVSH